MLTVFKYLSPERARGLPHDTRKSDVWSLGITFFEILVGRTPFENSDGEQFTTKEELEKYWSRTVCQGVNGFNLFVIDTFASTASWQVDRHLEHV